MRKNNCLANRRSNMGKYRSRLSFLTAIGIISIFSTVRFVGAATDCMDLNPPLADKPYACFQTPGGYIFETAESAAARLGPGATIPCLDPITKTNVSVNDFPHKMQAVW